MEARPGRAVLSGISASFGYWPETQVVTSGQVTITPLPDIAETIAEMTAAEGIDKDWIYAPASQTRHFPSGLIKEKPFPSRIFGLPKTHALTNLGATGVEHLEFHIWGLSLFIGMRLTSTERGFVDATTVKPGKLVDFVLVSGLGSAVGLVESFWIANLAVPQRAKLIVAAIHALFLAQRPQLLQYEHFIYLYTALDACYALAADLWPPVRRPTHAARLDWLCKLFGMPTPTWALPAPKGSSPIATIRNATMHEALFMGEPLGFAIHGAGTGENLPLEMENLISRLLVALLGKRGAGYVATPVDTRQRHGLDLS